MLANPVSIEFFSYGANFTNPKYETFSWKTCPRSKMKYAISPPIHVMLCINSLNSEIGHNTITDTDDYSTWIHAEGCLYLFGMLMTYSGLTYWREFEWRQQLWTGCTNTLLGVAKITCGWSETIKTWTNIQMKHIMPNYSEL